MQVPVILWIQYSVTTRTSYLNCLRKKSSFPKRLFLKLSNASTSFWPC